LFHIFETQECSGGPAKAVGKSESVGTNSLYAAQRARIAALREADAG
jgi:hypothetical protein